MLAHRPRGCSASTQPWGSCKQLSRPGLSWSRSWSGIMRTSRPRWLNRCTPHSGRSSPKWVKPIWWGFFPGFSPPLPILLQVLYALWVKHLLLSQNLEWMPQQVPPLQDSRAHQPQCPQAVHHIELALCLLQFFLCPTFQLPAPHCIPNFQAYHCCLTQEVGLLHQWCNQDH